MSGAELIQPGELAQAPASVLIDCRFSLADPREGRSLYRQGHIPGAFYLDLDEDLSGDVAQHGGRHPLPAADRFTAALAALGVGPTTDVIAYDDSRLAYAARLWWLMRSIGFKPPRLLDGGYQAWLELAGQPETVLPQPTPCAAQSGRGFSGVYDIAGLRQAMERGALVVDSREARRYQGLEEPIDPVAGHIPGAINRPWLGVTNESGKAGSTAAQRAHWGDVSDAAEVIVYCGSGVTACVNLFSLALIGTEDACLYGGSWSDWCSYL